jgi:membrane protein DedA with SNARE-associated domain
VSRWSVTMPGPPRTLPGARRGPSGPRPRPARRGPRPLLVALAFVAIAALLAVMAGLEGDLPDDFSRAGHLVGALVRRYGTPASLALLYVEESGIPLPVPGDVYVAYLGTAAAGSVARLLVTWVAITAVVVAGSTNLYLVSRRWARRLVTGRGGPLPHLDPDRLARVEGWLARWGALAIIFGRHVPGFRVPITVLAGTFGVRYPVFAASVAVSTAIWAGIWLLVSARFGPGVVRFLVGHRSLHLLVVAAALVILAAALVLAWQSSGRRQQGRPR